MNKKNIIPLIVTILIALVVLTILRQVVLPLIDMPNKLTEIIAVALSAMVGGMTGNLLRARAGKNKE